MKKGNQNNKGYQLLDINQRQNLGIKEEEAQDAEDCCSNNACENQNEEKFAIENKSQNHFQKKLQFLWNEFFYQINEKEFKKWAIISLIMTLLVWLLHQSLKIECPVSSVDECFKKYLVTRLKLWIPIILINSLCILMQIHILIEKKTHFLFPLMSLCSVFYILVIRTPKISLNKEINMFHIIFCLALLLIYGLIRIERSSFKKNKGICLLSNFLVISSFILIIYFSKVQGSCDDWTQGINGEIDTEINPNMCKIKTPTYCWYKITNGWQDLSSILRPSCKDFSQDSVSFTQTFDSHFEKSVGKSQFVGFQNLNSISNDERMDHKIQGAVFEKAKGYSNLLDAKKAGHDVVFDRKNKTYNIEIQRNETLVKEREKLQNKSSLAKNVLLIFVDAVSRSSMHFKLPKTVEWFKKRSQYHSYQTNSTNNSKPTNQSTKDIPEGESYEFYRFHSLVPYTYNNLQYLYYGNTKENITLDDEQKWKGIVEEFKQQGYITGHSNDYCQSIAIGYNAEIRGMSDSLRYDHETLSYACDPNYTDSHYTFGLFQGPFSILNRCLYGKSLVDSSMEYAKSFLQTYKNEQKFLHLEFEYGHEGTGEVIRFLDEPLSQFLEESSSSGLLDDTVVIVVNDHGFHMQFLLYLMHLENVFTEINLPGLFIHLPESMNAKYRKEISENQQNLASVKNVHHFLKDIIHGKSENSTLSLLSSLNHQTSCYQLDINDKDYKEYCSCL